MLTQHVQSCDDTNSVTETMSRGLHRLSQSVVVEKVRSEEGETDFGEEIKRDREKDKRDNICYWRVGLNIEEEEVAFYIRQAR